MREKTVSLPPKGIPGWSLRVTRSFTGMEAVPDKPWISAASPGSDNGLGVGNGADVGCGVGNGGNNIGVAVGCGVAVGGRTMGVAVG